MLLLADADSFEESSFALESFYAFVTNAKLTSFGYALSLCLSSG
jgi:hypothetical protein